MSAFSMTATVRTHDGEVRHTGFDVTFRVIDEGICAGDLVVLARDRVPGEPRETARYRSGAWCHIIVTTTVTPPVAPTATATK